MVFVRTKKAEGGDNWLYVHEVYTEDEIRKPDGLQTAAAPGKGAS